jgi:hypothetical protein
MDVIEIEWKGEECLNFASRYSDWLRAGRLRGRVSSPGRVKNFFFSTYIYLECNKNETSCPVKLITLNLFRVFIVNTPDRLTTESTVGIRFLAGARSLLPAVISDRC